MRTDPSSALSRYGTAALAAALATGARLLLDPVLGDQFPFALYLLAALFAAWAGGFGPAVVAVALGGLAAGWFFLPPRGSFAVAGREHQVGLGVYLVIGLAVALLGGAMAAGRRRAERRAAEAAAEREKLRVTLASIGDAVVVTDDRGRVVSLNGVAEALTGWAQADAAGRPLDEVFAISNEHTGRPVDSPVARVLAEGRAVGLANHTVLTARDGTRRPIDDSAAPIRGAGGAVLGVVLVFRDVTAQRQAEADLRRSERELADFCENATEGLHRVGPDGTILWANRAELDLLGYARDEYVGRKITEFHADPQAIADILRRLQAGEALHNYEARLRCKDGSVRHVLINSNVHRPDGRFAHTRCFTRDVTDRKWNEAVLAGQKRVLELLVHGAPLADVLDALCEVIERQAEQALTATVLLVDPDGRRLRSAAGRRAPAEYAWAIDGVPIGPAVGSCGTAAHRGEPVVVADIATDPLWAGFRDLALGHGLRACWSTPIFSSAGRVLGTFAVYYPVPRRPTPEEARLVDILTRTAGVAIERRRAEEALREEDRRKDEFLATLAHELRNPLAPMRNALQVIQLSGNDPAAVARSREVMERQMRHLVRLVDDLLDVSRITRGKLDLRRQRVDLGAVVRTAVEASRPLVDAAGHELTVALPPAPVFVDGDPVRLAQVFSNLLNNAAKYTDPGGRIRLAVDREGSDAVVSVRDTGLGIPADMLGRVFELFTQVAGTLEKAQGGLGIGLTLVRRLTEMHGGTVTAHSDGPGTGSQFVVRLPAVLPAAPAGEAAAAAAGPRPAGHRILVVDDNRDAALSLAMMLELMGNEVRTAHDGREAVAAAGEFRPEVVVLDIGLPLLNGYEAARRMRAEPWGREAVLIAVTGWGQEEDKRRSREAGFNFHLVKPVEPAALERLLGGLLTSAAGPGRGVVMAPGP